MCEVLTPMLGTTHIKRTQVTSSKRSCHTPCKHAIRFQYRACTGPMLTASAQYRPGTGTQRHVYGAGEITCIVLSDFKRKDGGTLLACLCVIINVRYNRCEINSNRPIVLVKQHPSNVRRKLQCHLPGHTAGVVCANTEPVLHTSMCQH